MISSTGSTSEAIINSGTITAESNYGVPAAIMLWPANGKVKLTINGGKISSNVYAIVGNGSNQDGTEVYINGGIIESTGGTAIYHPQLGDISINNGEVVGACPIEMRSGNLNISGGYIHTTESNLQTRNSNNGNTVYGAAVAISQHTTQKDININITGGTFEGPYALYEADHTEGSINTGNGYKNNITISVSDGIFNGKIYRSHFIILEKI